MFLDGMNLRQWKDKAFRAELRVIELENDLKLVKGELKALKARHKAKEKFITETLLEIKGDNEK